MPNEVENQRSIRKFRWSDGEKHKGMDKTYVQLWVHPPKVQPTESGCEWKKSFTYNSSIHAAGEVPST